MRWFRTLSHTSVGAAPRGCFFRRSVTGLAALFVLLLPVPTWPQSVDALLSDPATFDRQEVTVTGQLTSLIIGEGEKPYTKFKLGDAAKTIPVFMRGVRALTEGETYEVGGVFLVKPASDGSKQISGIVGQTVLLLEEEPLEEEPLEFVEDETAEEFAPQELANELSESEETDVEGPPGLLVADLLEDPAAFDRLAVSLAGAVTTLRVTDGDNPSTKFKLHDVSGEIPVFMRGARSLTEGESYEIDGVFLVKPTNDGTGEVSGIVASTVEPVEPEPAPVSVAEAPADEQGVSPAYTAPTYAVRELLADQAQFDRRFVSVTGQVTSLTTRYGARTYQKFKLTDASGTIPIFIPGTSSCEQGQICKVTGVFLIKRTQDGESEISGIKADATEKVEDAPYLQWTSLVFQEQLGEPGYNSRLPGGSAFPE